MERKIRAAKSSLPNAARGALFELLSLHAAPCHDGKLFVPRRSGTAGRRPASSSCRDAGQSKAGGKGGEPLVAGGHLDGESSPVIPPQCHDGLRCSQSSFMCNFMFRKPAELDVKTGCIEF